jgi:hypothetical protein
MNSDVLREIHKDLVDCSRRRLSKVDLMIKLTQFKDIIRTSFISWSSKEKNLVIDTNYDILSAIKFELDYLIREPHMRPNNDIIRLRDRIYADLLRQVEIENEMRKVTNIFNEFFKGITYFNGQIPNTGNPIYHRPNYSCKSRGEQNEICIAANNSTQNSRNNKKLKKDRIRLCYIERLAYDELWSKLIFSAQNISHIDWLGNTKNAYQTCFGEDKEIFVEIEMNDNNTLPLILKIYDDKIIEVYEKTYNEMNKTYVNQVFCFQYDENNIEKRKTNTFELNANWPA